MASFAPLDKSQPIVNEDGTMSPRTQAWVELVTRLSTIQGSGTPEDVIEARAARFYMDDDNGDLYLKHLNDIGGNRKKGWILKS